MKLDKKNIKWFENEQKHFGTEVALYNWQFMLNAGAHHFSDIDTETPEEWAKRFGKKRGKSKKCVS